MAITKITGTNISPAIAYFKAGNGPVLVLIHGFPMNHKLWDKVFSELAEQFTVIAPDLPGSGESEYYPELSMEFMAGCIKTILDHEQIDKAVIAGHSMGGYVAIAFAELYKERLAGLAFVHSMASADTEEKKEQRRKSIDLLKKGGKDIFVRQMMPGLYSEHFKKEHPGPIADLTKQALLTETVSLVAFYNAMINRPDRVSVLKTLDRPVLWIIGEEDKIATKEIIMQQCSHTNVNFVKAYSDCGHMSMVEQPNMLLEDLKEFTAYCAEYGKKK